MTSFKGNKTGFNKSGSNDCVPNMSGPPATKFTGRGSVPAGPLKRYPGGTASVTDGNRRLAKSDRGAGEGGGTNFCGRTAFNRGGK